MARYDRKLEAAGEASLDIVEWISGLAARDHEKASDSHGAKVARLLSGIDRGEALDGAFSPSTLRPRKGE